VIRKLVLVLQYFLTALLM